MEIRCVKVTDRHTELDRQKQTLEDIDSMTDIETATGRQTVADRQTDRQTANIDLPNLLAERHFFASS